MIPPMMSGSILQGQFDLLPGHGFQLLADEIQFGVAEPLRRRHFGHHDAALGPQLVGEHLPDIGISIVRSRSINMRARLRASGCTLVSSDVLERLDPALRRHTGVRQIGGDPIVGHDPGEHRQIVAPGVERSLLLAQAEDRLGVPFCRAAGHGRPFLLALAV